MTFRFDETMCGFFRESKPTGRCGRFDFTCRARPDDLVQFLKDRTVRISGTATMEGVVDAAPMEGTLRIDPILCQELVYDFAFRAGESRYRYLGRKSVRFLDPVTSMTTLIGRVEKDGVTLGDVESHFNLLDLPAFLWSFSLEL